MNQKFTSKGTSINKGKLPAIYGKLAKLGVNLETETAIDYGCGRYFDTYGLPDTVYGYDPYHKRNEALLDNYYDIGICSNVLNVIAEPEVREEILFDLARCAETVYITVYEGDKSGKGKQTGVDSWQENRRLKDYLEEVEDVFSEVAIKNGVMICRYPWH